MAPKKAKKTLGKKAMKKTKGGIVIDGCRPPAIVDGTSNTLGRLAQKQVPDGSV